MGHFWLIHLNTPAGHQHTYNIPESSASGNSVITNTHTHAHSHMRGCLPPVPDCFSVFIKLSIERRSTTFTYASSEKPKERKRESFYSDIPLPPKSQMVLWKVDINIQQLVNEKRINIIYMVRYIKWNCINTSSETKVINNEAYLCMRVCLDSHAIMIINTISPKCLLKNISKLMHCC